MTQCNDGFMKLQKCYQYFFIERECNMATFGKGHIFVKTYTTNVLFKCQSVVRSSIPVTVFVQVSFFF